MKIEELPLIETAIKAVHKAGKAILEVYEQDFKVEHKADHSPLTEADRAAHRIIVQELRKTPFPLLSEEGEAVAYEERKTWQYYWLVDPLDGTKEFVRRNGEFTVNIALIEKGIPVIGVVYAPVLQTMFFGSTAAKAKRKSWRTVRCAEKSVREILETAEPCAVRQIAATAPLCIVLSRSHCCEETNRVVRMLEERYGKAELVSSGSSLKLCMIAEGRADVYPRPAPTMEWDTAAAHAVLSAAGGRVFEYISDMAVTNLALDGKKDLRYNKSELRNPGFVAVGRTMPT